jgi:hypothetical protein
VSHLDFWGVGLFFWGRGIGSRRGVVVQCAGDVAHGAQCEIL